MESISEKNNRAHLEQEKGDASSYQLIVHKVDLHFIDLLSSLQSRFSPLLQGPDIETVMKVLKPPNLHHKAAV
jgi:hypothetical protein